MIFLDSRVRGNDKKGSFLTFYEFVNFRILNLYSLNYFYLINPSHLIKVVLNCHDVTHHLPFRSGISDISHILRVKLASG